MMEAVRNGAWAKSGAPLPYDAEVEWISSDTKNQSAIDTGIVPNSNTRIDARFSTGSGYYYNCWFFGCSNTNSVWNGNIFEVGMKHHANIGSKFFATLNLQIFDFGVAYGIYDGHVINVHVDFTGRYIDFDGLRGEMTDSFSTNTSLAVLGVKFPNGKYFSSQNGGFVRMMSFEIHELETKILDFIPVRFTNENGDNEGAMYDRVSGRLFRNSGTGAFVIGPDKTT